MKKIVLSLMLFVCLVFVFSGCGGGGGGSGDGSAKITPDQPITYSIQITPSQFPSLFILGGTQQKFSAVVKDSKGNAVADAVVIWSVSSETAGSFSVKQTTGSAETIFTASSQNFRGTIIADYNGSTSSTDITIGIIDKVTVTSARTAAIVGGDPLTLNAVVTANGYTLNPQPTVNWTSSSPGAASVTPSGASATLTPIAAGSTNITATVQGTSVQSTAVPITIKTKATINFAATGFTYTPYYTTTQPTASFSGSEVKVVLPPGTAIAMHFPNNVPADYSGYTKLLVTLRGSAGGELVGLGIGNTSYSNMPNLTNANTVYTVSVPSGVNMSSLTTYFYLAAINAGVGGNLTKTVYINKIELN